MIQFARGLEVVAEWFLDDNPLEAAVLPLLAEVLDDVGKGFRRRCEIEQMIRFSPELLVEFREVRAQAREVFTFAVVGLHVGETRREFLPNVFVDRLDAPKL